MTDSTETKLDGRTREAKAAAQTDATPPSRRRKRATLGGFTLKLEAEQRPNMVRRWVNGTPTRIHEMHELGYDFVTDKPTGDGPGRTDGQGSRISRHSGTDANGQAMQMFLMETPQEEYAHGLADKEERLKPFEDAIRAGGDPAGGLAKGETYLPGGASNTITRTG